MENGKTSVEKINKSTNKVDVDFIGVSNSPFIICGKSNQLCDGTIYLTIRYASNLEDNGQYELKATMKDLSDPNNAWNSNRTRNQCLCKYEK